jgi:hypothetical protein
MTNELVWTKHELYGEVSHAAGPYKIIPIKDNWYKWHLSGAKDFHPTHCFRTLKAAKEFAQHEQDLPMLLKD